MRRALVRGLHGTASSRALPALTNDAPAAPRSLLASLLGGSRGPAPVPLSQPLPGVVEPPYTQPTSAPTASVKKLANGALLGAEETPVRSRRSRRLHIRSSEFVLGVFRRGLIAQRRAPRLRWACTWTAAASTKRRRRRVRWWLQRKGRARAMFLSAHPLCARRRVARAGAPRVQSHAPPVGVPRHPRGPRALSFARLPRLSHPLASRRR